MRAVVFTDIMQFIALGIGIPLALFLGISKAGGWSEVLAAAPQHLDFFGGMGVMAFACTRFDNNT